MSQRVFLFVVVLIFVFNGENFAQQNVEKKFVVKMISSNKEKNLVGHTRTDIYKPQHVKLRETYSINKPNHSFRLYPVPINFFAGNLSFFCKQELQLEKITSIPLRFRLGSLDYVNYLEQKPNALKPE